MTQEEKDAIKAEEERKERESQQDFYQTQTDKLKQRQTYDPLASTNFARRSQRVKQYDEYGATVNSKFGGSDSKAF